MSTLEMNDNQAAEDIEMAMRQIKSIQALSSEQVWEIRQAFSHFDKQCSGNIGTKELGSLFRALGQNLSDEELLQIIIRVDVDHDGQLDFPEFLHLMSCIMRRTKSEDIYAECFHAFDTERRGCIKASSLRSQLEAVYAVNGVPEADVRELFQYLNLPSKESKATSSPSLCEKRCSSTIYDNISEKSANRPASATPTTSVSSSSEDWLIFKKDFNKWLQTPPLSSPRNEVSKESSDDELLPKSN